jgi:hypothetical protein
MTPPEHERWREELREFEEAAIEAELETGGREESIEQARRHLLVRVARVAAGIVLCGVGIALLVLPGPGLVVLAAGLALLAQDVPFARRLLEQVSQRLPESEDGQVSKLFIAVCSVGGLLFMGLSVWWTFFR